MSDPKEPQSCSADTPNPIEPDQDHEPIYRGSSVEPEGRRDVRRTPFGDIDILNPDQRYVRQAEARYERLGTLVDELAGWRLLTLTLASVEGLQDRGPAVATSALLRAVKLAYAAHDELVGAFARALALADMAKEEGLRSRELPAHALADAVTDLRRYIDHEPDYDRAEAVRRVDVIADRWRDVLPQSDEFIGGGES